jgi:hypothetical protein
LIMAARLRCGRLLFVCCAHWLVVLA